MRGYSLNLEFILIFNQHFVDWYVSIKLNLNFGSIAYLIITILIGLLLLKI